MKPVPTETRLLGLNPAQYTRLKERSRLDAARLRREAIAEAFARAFAALRRAFAASRPLGTAPSARPLPRT